MSVVQGLFFALDPGTKKTGVAIGNTITNMATALEPVDGNAAEQLTRLADLYRVWKPQLAVIGQPAGDGTAKKARARSDELAEELRRKLKIPVEFIDEAYSTQAARAERALSGQRRASGIDSHAARLLAEAWLADLLRREAA
ncbi:MAG: Holliday junction resolvase RuvX [Betaproteobacteria bacterium AqS2]|uniref:Putative pre-16S rRNA nuclease n=1 Tax=Candidatus Amphirhobacter heronislandensis TaxID=1732024 RepID=A0A930Y129_9GAMM|nr:Holliday junction resolvase RuvX [Betaproteobacteria bacterium AqS2]